MRPSVIRPVALLACSMSLLLSLSVLAQTTEENDEADGSRRNEAAGPNAFPLSMCDGHRGSSLEVNLGRFAFKVPYADASSFISTNNARCKKVQVSN